METVDKLFFNKLLYHLHEEECKLSEVQTSLDCTSQQAAKMSKVRQTIVSKYTDHLGAVEANDPQEVCPECSGRDGYHFSNCVHNDPNNEDDDER